MNLVVRQFTIEDEKYFSDGLELLNRTQGRDLFGPDYLLERTQDLKSGVFAAFDGDTLVGLGVAQLINNYDFYLPFAPNIYEEFKDKNVGSFSTLCTLESYQGKGVGQKISHLRLQWLKEQKCDVIVGVSWVSGKAHTSNRVFEKMGFKAVKKVERFFYQMSIDRPFDCPGCNQKPCTCAAILYKQELYAAPS